MAKVMLGAEVECEFLLGRPLHLGLEDGSDPGEANLANLASFWGEFPRVGVGAGDAEVSGALHVFMMQKGCDSIVFPGHRMGVGRAKTKHPPGKTRWVRRGENLRIASSI